MSSEENKELLDEIKTALSVCQCAEDSTTEEHVKRALGFVNSTLCAVVLRMKVSV